jgi:hypothetical protein
VWKSEGGGSERSIEKRWLGLRLKHLERRGSDWNLKIILNYSQHDLPMAWMLL